MTTTPSPHLPPALVAAVYGCLGVALASLVTTTVLAVRGGSLVLGACMVVAAAGAVAGCCWLVRAARRRARWVGRVDRQATVEFARIREEAMADGFDLGYLAQGAEQRVRRCRLRRRLTRDS